MPELTVSIDVLDDRIEDDIGLVVDLINRFFTVQTRLTVTINAARVSILQTRDQTKKKQLIN